MPAKPLNQIFSGMPQMSAAFQGWKIKLALLKIVQTVIDGFVVNNEALVTFSGTWQPLSPEMIKLYPEGQWSWEWIDLHVDGSKLLFQTNDRISRNGLIYKVMAVKDYTLNNFSEYYLIRDYEFVLPTPIDGIVMVGDDIVLSGEDVVIDDTGPIVLNGDEVVWNGNDLIIAEAGSTAISQPVTYNGEPVTYNGDPVTILVQ